MEGNFFPIGPKISTVSPNTFPHKIDHTLLNKNCIKDTA